MKNRKWTKAALALSAFLFVIWWALGTGATIAWFSDTDTIRNDFQIGLIDLDVSYRNDLVQEYTPLQGTTKAFNDQALYEPGYTQVVWLKIDNKGDVDFNYKLAVTVEKVSVGVNAWNDPVYLPDYLRYGVVFGQTEESVQQQIAQRIDAQTIAPYALSTWSEISPYTFEAGETPHYAALIVYMPEEVGDIANYRGAAAPKVELGITVFAQQANAALAAGQ